MRVLIGQKLVFNVQIASSSNSNESKRVVFSLSNMETSKTVLVTDMTSDDNLTYRTVINTLDYKPSTYYYHIQCIGSAQTSMNGSFIIDPSPAILEAY